MQLVTSCCFLLLLSSSVCRTFCEENGFLCCVSNYTRHTKHTVWYSTSEPFLNSQSPRDSISLVSRHTAGQVSKYHPDTKSCWITERNPEHSKQLSASFHHHAATSQVSALKSSSYTTLYWRNLRYSVCLPQKKKKTPNGEKNVFPLEIQLQSHSEFLLWKQIICYISDFDNTNSCCWKKNNNTWSEKI